MIAASQWASVTSREPDENSKRRRAIVKKIDHIKNRVQSVPIEALPIESLNAQIDPIAEELKATQKKEDAAVKRAERRRMTELIRYEKAQAKARLQSVCAESSSAKKPNPPVGPSPALAMLDRIRAHQNIGIETWASDHRLNRSQIFDWKRAGGRPVKGKVSEDYARKIEATIWSEADRLGLKRTD